MNEWQHPQKRCRPKFASLSAMEGSSKKMRPLIMNSELLNQSQTGLTPVPFLRARHHRYFRSAGLRDQEMLNDTLGISFTGNEKLESPFFDRNKSKSFYQSCFEPIATLGKGSFGAVHKCRSKDDGKLYAVKILKEGFRSIRAREQALREVRLLECLPYHENVVRFVRAWQEGQKLFIQTELCSEDVLTFLRGLTQPASPDEDPPYMQPDKVPEDLCWGVMIDLLKAARHLHQNQVLHLDIKPENVFISIEDGRCKLGDFGLACSLDEGKASSMQEGDGRYAAPETYCDSTFLPQADSYSIGCSVLQLALGIVDPRHARHEGTWTALKQRPDLWQSHFSEQMKDKTDELWSLLRWLLTEDMSSRPTPQVVLEQPSIKVRLVERERMLSRNRFMFRLRSIASNVLQAVSTLLPLDLLTRLRPLIWKPLPNDSRSASLTSLLDASQDFPCVGAPLTSGDAPHFVESSSQLDFLSLFGDDMSQASKNDDERLRFGTPDAFKKSSTPNKPGSSSYLDSDDDFIPRVNLSLRFGDLGPADVDEPCNDVLKSDAMNNRCADIGDKAESAPVLLPVPGVSPIRARTRSRVPRQQAFARSVHKPSSRRRFKESSEGAIGTMDTSC